MNSYLFNFLLALFLSVFLLILFKKQIKPFCFKCGLFVVPTLIYLFFFNYDLGLIHSPLVYIVGYVGCIWTFFSFLLLVSFKKEYVQWKQKFIAVKELLLLVAQLALVAVFFAIPWAIDTFPLSNPDAVLFTLYAPIEGSNDFVIQELKEKVVKPSLITFFCVIVIQIILSLWLRKRKISGVFQKCGIRFYLPMTEMSSLLVYQISKLLSFLLLGCVVINLLIFPSIINSDSYKALLMKSADSPLYKEYFIEPTKANCAAEKKNLIVIFLESMTNNFKQYTPELNSWKRKGISFYPGAMSVSGTSWTIAGITSALCGLPLNMPITDREYQGVLPTYLPNAVCLMDLLENEDYNQVFVQGSSAEFTQKRQFWTHHGHVTVRDDSYYKSLGYVSPNYGVFWGIEDRKTLSYAKEELDSLSKQKKPFALYYLSVDTHQPEGYLDSLCNFGENSKYKNVLRCSSAMVGNFLTWVQNQSWYENTIVVVVGDHIIQSLAEKVGLPQNEKLYTMAFFLNADFENVQRERFFTNLDYAPSILEMMGWNLPNHGFGLGRSLFSSEKTVLEVYGVDSLNALLRQRSIQYDYFLFGK